MLNAAKEGRFRTLYFESLSRLARELVITLPMLKELVDVHGIRIVSVSEGIDSKIGNWELVAIFNSWMHAEYLKALRSAVLRGQEEAVLNGWSVGEWCFGYDSQPIPGSESARRGRNPKPRMRVVIDDEDAAWVRRIFSWFVQERRSVSSIVRELNRLKAPKDHRSCKPHWHHSYVTGLLRNRKYIGVWPWGAKTNRRNPLTGQIWREARPLDERAKWERERPELRIVDDETFFRAEALLEENKKNYARMRRQNGQLRGSITSSAQPRHLLQGLIKCGECGSTFQMTGGPARYLGCAGHIKGTCSCKTRLPRQLAERLILEALGQRIVGDPEWANAVLEAAQAAWTRRRRDQPKERGALERTLTQLDRRIERLVDSIENGVVDPSVSDRLAARRRERQKVERELEQLNAHDVDAPAPPSIDWVKDKLGSLDEVLKGGQPNAAITLKALVGSVIVREVEQTDRKRKFLCGTFELTTAAISKTMLTPSTDEPNEKQVTEDVSIDFVESPPWAAIADDVKRMFDEGIEYRRIAEQLGCTRSWVPKAMAWWHRKRGLPVPDGRRHKQRLARTTKPQRIADAVMELFEQGLPMLEIAKQMNCCANTVTAAVRHWHVGRNLQPPDGRHRRKNRSATKQND